MPNSASPAGPEFARIRVGFGASAYFGGLPAPSLDRLASIATLERFDNGGLVHPAGTPAEKLSLVLAGGLSVSWATDHHPPVTIAMIGEGGFYNIGAFVEGVAFETEARAERNTVLASIDGAALRALMHADTSINELVPRLIVGRVQTVMSLYVDVVSAPLRRRLARRLLSQAMASGKRCGRTEFELPVSQTALAQMLAASRSKVNAELRKLERDGIVRLGYR
ncbi:MAG: Crp/Fnr family transcriptional regulator, partial [Ramlibacter sp.]|nr:Crp/Fnr family transcriptional regulator [Ramlibacter sp.]